MRMYIPLKLQKNGYVSYISLNNFIVKNKHIWKREYSTINSVTQIPWISRFCHIFSFSLFLFMSFLVYFKAIPRANIIFCLRGNIWMAENFPKPMKATIHTDSKISTIPKQDKKKSTSRYFLQKPQHTKTKRKSEKQPGGLPYLLKVRRLWMTVKPPFGVI